MLYSACVKTTHISIGTNCASLMFFPCLLKLGWKSKKPEVDQRFWEIHFCCSTCNGLEQLLYKMSWLIQVSYKVSTGKQYINHYFRFSCLVLNWKHFEKFIELIKIKFFYLSFIFSGWFFLFCVNEVFCADTKYWQKAQQMSVVIVTRICLNSMINVKFQSKK